MKIMVLHNTAGALTPVADWMNDHGHQVSIFTTLDLFGHSSYSPSNIFRERRGMYETLIKYIIETDPDVIHINSAHQLIPFIRLFTQRTPIVFMYHGSEARTRADLGLSHRLEVEWSDRILVSTPDLQSFGEWYDRPIPSFFQYQGGRVKGSALMIYAEFFAEFGKDQRNLAREVCDKLGLDLYLFQNRNENPIPYLEMPQFYSRFEYYLDFKGHDTEETFALSKSGLEAMACGCKVLQDQRPYDVLDPKEFLKNEDDLNRQYMNLYLGLEKAPASSIVPRFVKAVARILTTPRRDPYGTVYGRPTFHGLKKIGFYVLSLIKYLKRGLRS